MAPQTSLESRASFIPGRGPLSRHPAAAEAVTVEVAVAAAAAAAALWALSVSLVTQLRHEAQANTASDLYSQRAVIYRL